MKAIYKPILDNSLAIILLLLISCIYFYPQLQGKRLNPSDVVQYKGMSNKIDEFRENNNEEALWAVHLFSGMPAYQISVDYKYNIFLWIIKLKNEIPSPIRNLFFYLLGFYVLLISLNFKPMLSFLGSLCFGFSTYLFMILEAGHMTKSYVISTIPLVFAGVFLIFRGKYFLGFLITLFFMSLNICGNHYQMTYYYMFCIAILFVVKLIFYFKQNKLKKWLCCFSVFSIAVLISILSNFANIWTTKEYSKESIRGNPQLSLKNENTTDGLDRDRILSWSYGKLETFNLFIPAFVGGSREKLDKKSNYYKAFKNRGVPEYEIKNYVRNAPTYWGDQPFVNGPNYIGATVIFLFFVACFLLRGPLFWWAIISTIFSIMLAWGKNFKFLSDLFIDYVPFYSSFRAVSSILVISQFVVPLFAIFGLKYFFENKKSIQLKKKALKKSLYLLGGFTLFVIFFGAQIFDFSNSNDMAFNDYPFLLDALKKDRASLLYNDSIRTLVFILLIFSVLFMWLKNLIPTKYSIILLSLFTFLDLAMVDNRYLNRSHFVKPKHIDNLFQKSEIDTQILKDTTIYRVWNTSVNTFSDSRTSYFHRSIGGYHAAKLKNYQEVYDMHISKNNMQVINMLNAKYFIYNEKGKQKLYLNDKANGNAWIVDTFKIFNTAEEQISALAKFDSKKQAIVNNSIRKFDIKQIGSEPDSSAYIKIKKYKPNEIVYDFSSSKKEMVVFSEIYYPYGWNAYIDDKKVNYFRANYILRGMIIPSGNHQITFKFEPTSYFVGNKVSAATSIFIVLLFILYFIYYYKSTMRLGK